MSSERISVDPASLRTAADGNAAAAAQLDEYSRECRQWIADVEQEFLRCHGPVAAPVGAAMREFFDGIGDQAADASGEHSAMGDNLTTAAGRYEDADQAGSTAVNAATGGAL
ncbi:type VII secretion target [Mycobacteroides abscessus]|uniref:type VII secretion target n=1 Tax=Mycobacteroides abscessus TaxID=36809 RepID=UPI001878B4D4